MIEMQTAYTEEIDEVDEAVEALLGQIAFDKLRENTVALLNCAVDYLDSGVVAALAEKLPFGLMGMTTMSNGTNSGYGMYRLSLTVLTSDDASFSLARAPKLNSTNYYDVLRDTWQTAKTEAEEAPAMIVSYLPYIADLGASELVACLDEVTDGVPIFGSVSIGEDMTYLDSRTIFGDMIENDAAVMLLIRGAVNPRFFVTSIPERNIRENRAVITDSDGCHMKTLNDVSVIQYMTDLGIVLKQEDATTSPFMVYHNNESEPVALGIFTIMDDGSVILGGRVPKGAKIALGQIDTEGILDTARATLDEIQKSGMGNGLLLHPCVTRYIMLAPQQDDEHQVVSAALEGSVPFMLGYSGGEICPLLGDDGKYHNRFHNYSFSACAF